MEISKGDRVRIQSGTFADHVGDVDHVDAKTGKLVVWLKIREGGPSPVEVDCNQVMKLPPQVKHDPIENDPELGTIVCAAIHEANETIGRRRREFKSLGFFKAIWEETARILRDRHNIEWKNPGELNPDIPEMQAIANSK